jgi:transposase-like protein
VQYKNKYVFHGRISEDKFRELVRLFAIDIDAERVSILENLNRNTVNRYFMNFKERIAEISDRDSPFPKSEFEVDESYFGPRRVRGKRGRGAGKKTPVFGILKRGGKVYTEIVPDCTRDTLVKIIRGKVGLESIIHSDSWHSYDSLVDVGYEKHFRVNHGNNEFAPSNPII